MQVMGKNVNLGTLYVSGADRCRHVHSQDGGRHVVPKIEVPTKSLETSSHTSHPLYTEILYFHDICDISPYIIVSKTLYTVPST